MRKRNRVVGEREIVNNKRERQREREMRETDDQKRGRRGGGVIERVGETVRKSKGWGTEEKSRGVVREIYSPDMQCECKSGTAVIRTKHTSPRRK